MTDFRFSPDPKPAKSTGGMGRAKRKTPLKHRADFGKPRLYRRAFDWDEARTLYEGGETTKTLAKKYGVTATAVGNALKAMGVPRRPHWEVQPYHPGFRKNNEARKAQTHCKNGHELTQKNVYLGTKSGRNCRQCRRDSINASRAALKARGIKRLKGWHIYKKGELPICRNCGSNDRIELHHAVPRSKAQHAKHDLRNGIPLCFACHRGWHAKKVTVYRDVFSTDEWKFISSIQLTGENIGPWLDKHYPKRTRARVAA